MKLKLILASMLTIIGLLAWLVWISGFDKYQQCLDDPLIENSDCFHSYMLKSPPVQETQQMKESCDNSDTDCLMKIGQKAIEERITN